MESGGGRDNWDIEGRMVRNCEATPSETHVKRCCCHKYFGFWVIGVVKKMPGAYQPSRKLWNIQGVFEAN